MKITIPAIVLMLLAATAYGQNHVPNGSFEQRDGCPQSISFGSYRALTRHCTGWYQYTVGGQEGGTTDYFNTCATSGSVGVNVPSNFIGNQDAKHGNAYIGCYTGGKSISTGGSYKEYAAAAITPVKTGYTYEVTMYASLADNSSTGTDDLGIYFFKNAPDTFETDEVLPVAPQVSYSGLAPINKTEWTRLSKVFIPDSAYTHIVVGGFSPSTDTFFSYYYIDSVVVKIFEGLKLHLNDTIFCPGNQVAVSYTVDSVNYFNPGNVFTAQLSDSSGDFTFPADIGSIPGTGSGVINCTIPISSLHSGNYRIRILSSSPFSSFYADNASIGIYKLAPEATGTGELCAGEPLQLMVKEKVPGAAFSWTGPANYTSGAIADTLLNTTTDMTGIYKVIATLGNCSGTDTTNVLVKPLPGKPEASSNNPAFAGKNIELKVTNPNSSYSYRWEGPNGFLSQVQNPVLTNVNKSYGGIYTITAISAGCENKSELEVEVIELSDIGYFFIYPTPNNGNFTLQGFAISDQEIKYRIVNAVGQLILEGATDTKDKKVKLNISMPHVAAGDYLLQLRADGKNKSVKFTVLH